MFLSLSLIHFGGFFHEILPRFEHPWINTSFFIMVEKLWQYQRFLIFDELSSLYWRYMAIFAHSPNQCQISMALGFLRVGQVVMELIIILAKWEHDSLFVEASQLYSDLKFYFVLQICWVWVKGYLSERSPLFIKMINKLHQLPPSASLTRTQSVSRVSMVNTQSFHHWKRNVRMCMESSVHCIAWLMHFRHICYNCIDWA